MEHFQKQWKTLNNKWSEGCIQWSSPLPLGGCDGSQALPKPRCFGISTAAAIPRACPQRFAKCHGIRSSTSPAAHSWWDDAATRWIWWCQRSVFAGWDQKVVGRPWRWSSLGTGGRANFEGRFYRELRRKNGLVEWQLLDAQPVDEK